MARLAEAPVGRLATTSRDGMAHLVPVCFALVEGRAVSVVDHKPKRTLRLTRLQDMRDTGRAVLLVDHYSDDWSELWWIRVTGAATVHDPADAVDGAGPGGAGGQVPPVPGDPAVRTRVVGRPRRAALVARVRGRRLGNGQHRGARLIGRAPRRPAREAEVLRYLSEGLSNAEIATRLAIGQETVKTHLKRICTKTGARDRTQAVVWAYQTGFVAS